MTTSGSFSRPLTYSEAQSVAAKRSRDVFKALKKICVPLFSDPSLTPESIPRVSQLLSRLCSCLKSIPDPQRTLSSATISYVFFPLSHILQRNAISAIPDAIMEKLMDVFAILFEEWWWSCPTEIWVQIFMLSAAIMGGLEFGGDVKGKGKQRDDETKRATANCIWSVLRRRNQSETTDAPDSYSRTRAEERFNEFQSRARMPNLLPMFGQALTSLLDTAQSLNRDLQTTSLHIINTMIVYYFPRGFMPSVLPGVVSAMAKVALGHQVGKGWANGDTVCLALKVMQETIVRTLGDEVCRSEGAIRTISGLEDLASGFALDAEPRSVVTPSEAPSSPFFTPRTSVWLAASTSQLHIALNTLSPLLSHPNPGALIALSRFSQIVVSNTTQTLPETQPLLLSFLLSLSTSSFPNVADTSRGHLLMLLAPPSAARFSLLHILMRTTQDHLSALSRLFPSHSDSKVEHLARQVSAVCQLANDVHSVSTGVAKLLGPAGGVEKWGWSLLSVLELSEPPLFVSVQTPQALLEGGPESATECPFPTVQMKYVSSSTTREELDRMFRALGAAAGAECLFSIEWFVGVARSGRGNREVSALWCASKILEGVGGVSLNSPENFRPSGNKRVEKTARWIAKVISELWDQEGEGEDGYAPLNEDIAADNPENEGRLPLEYVKGLDPLITHFDLNKGDKPPRWSPHSQRTLHRALSLQLLSVTSAILQSQFARLFLYTLYPVLRSLVSENSYLSSTALAALHVITVTTAYATPSNLLLANFDYALDSVGRRLDRRHLDPEATKVLVVLIRLVGNDIVSRAGDVVEACFDRLDEFHGYSALAEGLIEVLAEVVKIAEADSDDAKDAMATETHSKDPEDRVEAFLQWYQHRNDQPEESEEDFGPAPRTAWADLDKGKGKDLTEEEATRLASNSADVDPPPTPTQALTQQIVERSVYFLTHPSPSMRARILNLLDTACPALSESTLLPSIHIAWPYVLNRLADSEPFVVSAAVSLIASLAEHVGQFMSLRIWEDVWPRFRRILAKLEAAGSQSALARRDRAAVGTDSAYSHSHRLYTSLLRTMRAVVIGIQLRQDVLWEVLVAFRQFLHIGVHEEMQLRAREVYRGLLKDNGDVIWLVLSASIRKDVTGSYEGDFQSLAFLAEHKWDIEANVKIVLGVP